MARSPTPNRRGNKVASPLVSNGLNVSRASLCEACAKEPILIRFVRENSGQRGYCGICLQTAKHARGKLVSLLKTKCLSNLMRALVRFHYDEDAYNSHWGGEDIAQVLAKDNPIIHHQSTLFEERSPARSEPFLNYLFEPAYPAPDEGIAIYAGFDHGVRLANSALKRARSVILADYRQRLAEENYFSIEPDLVRIFRKVKASRITKRLTEGAELYRARIGVEEHVTKLGPSLFSPKRLRRPFEAGSLGAPPPPLARPGRLNRSGVSFLYLASDADTAAAEVRPHPGHELSIGRFRSARGLKLANFTVELSDFASNDNDLSLFDFVHSADAMMSFPVTPEETARYSITQMIADVLRQQGFDGIAYKSSVSAGENVCVFDLGTFAYIPGSAEVRAVRALTYVFDALEIVT